ncbi:unnamed protein product [Pelagomonas calceolata]|uniref:BUB1 N-terminal domain-containing protein n=1 Tax=Pelagomonas calceolata TaxID=35677 RepID=A0A8J2T083_9STRA|nr:unnamed protein product [Pelagomonas calceolata]
MSALDTEAPAWETSKENAAPRKKGRDVAKLNRAFGAAPDDDAAIRHHEAALSTEGDDPLQAFTTYAAYLEQHRPTDALAAFELRERCCRAFRDDERYKNDARYVQMWLDYADNLQDPDDLFKFMKKKKVGLQSAAFWCAWALRSEERGHVKNAAELYKKGLEKGALPTEMLTAKQAAFEARAVDRERNPPPPRPRPRGLTAQRPSRAPTQQPQSTPAASGTTPALEIFVDEGLRPVTAPVDDWPDFGSLRERAKENTRGPTPWTEAALSAPKTSAPTLASAAPPAFDVFVDDDCVAAPAPAPDAPTTLRD